MAAPKKEAPKPGKPAKTPKPPKKAHSANEKSVPRGASEPALEEKLAAFCKAVEKVGGKPRGMLSADHVVIYRCALRELGAD